MLLRTKLLAISLVALLMVCVNTIGQQPTAQARSIQPASVSGDLTDIARANDGQLDTRATSNREDYAGLSVLIDVGNEQNIIGVIQDHGRWPTSYPGAYRVEVGRTASGPWFKAFEGPGQRGESKSLFPAVRGRFIRITATAPATLGASKDWSIAELRVGIDPGQTARQITDSTNGQSGSAPQAVTPLRDFDRAFDKDLATRATSGTPDYANMSFTFDLGGEYELSRVVQLHGRWADDYPAEYKIEVSRRRDEREFREVWRGSGAPGRSIARFDPVNTRYVRLTALRNRDREHPWSIAELRTNRDPDTVEREDEAKRLERPIRRATASGLSDINAAIDGNERTRATTGKPNYAGSWVLLDLGGSYTISKLLQVHNPDEGDFPGRYKVEVSEDGNRWQLVWEGEGERSRSNVSFNPVRARYVRITATSDRNNRNAWTIYNLEVQG